VSFLLKKKSEHNIKDHRKNHLLCSHVTAPGQQPTEFLVRSEGLFLTTGPVHRLLTLGVSTLHLMSLPAVSATRRTASVICWPLLMNPPERDFAAGCVLHGKRKKTLRNAPSD